MTERRKVSNLLGVAVLGTVVTRPMHPYEIASVMRARGKERDLPVKWGSLYRVVQNLHKHGFLRVERGERAGGHPERTVYAITDEGRAELVDWVRDLVAHPRPRRSEFRAGLSLLAALPPETAAEMLDERVRLLTERLDADRAELRAAAEEVPRMFLVESEYDLAMVTAELAWTRRLHDEIVREELPGVAEWREFHRSGAMPDEIADLHRRGADS